MEDPSIYEFVPGGELDAMSDGGAGSDSERKEAPEPDPIREPEPVIMSEDSCDTTTSESGSDEEERQDAPMLPALPVEPEPSALEAVPGVALAEPQPPPAAAPAAAGAPSKRAFLEVPVYPGASYNIGAVLQELMSVEAQYNMTERSCSAIHDLLMRCVNKDFPSYYRAKNIMKGVETPQNHHPACIDDCYVHPLSLNQLDEAQLAALKCPHCAKPLVDENGRVRKVSLPRIAGLVVTNCHYW
jgi:hypothetical protein